MIYRRNLVALVERDIEQALVLQYTNTHVNIITIAC